MNHEIDDNVENHPDSKQDLKRRKQQSYDISVTEVEENGTESFVANFEEKKNSFTWAWILASLVAVGGTIFVVLQFLQGENQEAAFVEDTVRALPVKVMQVDQVESYRLTRNYTGEVVAQRSSDLGLERSGTLTKIFVSEGDRVEAGEILAQLDIQSLLVRELELKAQLDQEQARLKELQSGPRTETITAARSTVRQLEAELELEQARLARREALYKEGAIAQEQLEEAQTSAASFAARLDVARSNLKELQVGTRSEQIQAQEAAVRQLNASLASLKVDLRKTTLTAPFTGTVDNRFVDEGTVVSSGEPVLRLIESGVLEARVGVPIETTTSLSVGSLQQLQIGARYYTASVTAILPTLDESTRTAIVVLDLEPGVRAIPQQLVQMELQETVEAKGFWLPTTALVPSVQGLWSVFVLSPNPVNSSNREKSDAGEVYQVEQRDIEILDTKGDIVLVRGMLQPGEQVIMSGVRKITLGQLVRPSAHTSHPDKLVP